MERAASERIAQRLWELLVGDVSQDVKGFMFSLPDHHVLPYTIGLILTAKDAKAKGPYLGAIFRNGGELEAAKKNTPDSWGVWAFVRGNLFPIDPVLDDDERKEEEARRYKITRAWMQKTGYGTIEKDGYTYEGHHPTYEIAAYLAAGMKCGL